MMMNLFSSFDACSGNLNYINFIVLFSFFFLPLSFWLVPSRLNWIFLSISLYLNKEFFLLLGKKLFGGILIYLTLFFLILNFNLLGMIPYIFTMTSQLSMNLFLALVFFLTFFLLGWFKLPETMFAHLTPLGSPLALSPFLVLIEKISALIRPITLSVRLSANIVSGHILLEIILEPSQKFSFLCFLYFFLVLPILLLEIMVCFVQSYVFSSLSVLYMGEPISH